MANDNKITISIKSTQNVKNGIEFYTVKYIIYF